MHGALKYFSDKMLSQESLSKQPAELLVKFKNQGIKILNEFFTKFAWDKIIVLDNELSLDEPIFDRFNFVGKIDFVYRYKHFIYIADFKTSTKEWDKWKFDDEYYGLQLKLYKWFYCKKMNIPFDGIRLVYMVLNRNEQSDNVQELVKMYEIPSSYGELKKAYNILVDALHTIYNPELIGDYLRKTIGYNCNICEFNGTEWCGGNVNTNFYRKINKTGIQPQKKTTIEIEDSFEKIIQEILNK